MSDLRLCSADYDGEWKHCSGGVVEIWLDGHYIELAVVRAQSPVHNTSTPKGNGHLAWTGLKTPVP